MSENQILNFLYNPLEDDVINAPEYEDILVKREGPLFIITINRPQRFNAFRGKTVDELVNAFRYAWAETHIRVVILTGVGEQSVLRRRRRKAEGRNRRLRTN